MRADMGKVITERPRTQSRNKLRQKGYSKRLQREGLDVDKHEPIKRLKGGERNFTDVLGPIVGFLEKNCGRPWSKVCSEISASLPASGGVSYSHARDHLFQMVEEHTQVIDGEVCDSKGDPLMRGWHWERFYVDQHGLLRRVKSRRGRRKKPHPKIFPKTEAGEWLIKDDNGVWWACEMAPYVTNGSQPHPLEGKYNFLRYHPIPTYPVVYDAYLQEQITAPNQLRFYAEYPWQDGKVYCCRRRQLGKREIKKYGLRTGATTKRTDK